MYDNIENSATNFVFDEYVVVNAFNVTKTVLIWRIAFMQSSMVFHELFTSIAKNPMIPLEMATKNVNLNNCLAVFWLGLNGISATLI